MDEFNFTEDEIKEQLEILGYRNVPPERLQEFKKDLVQLVRHERSKNSSTSTVDSEGMRPQTSSRSHTADIHIAKPHVIQEEESRREPFPRHLGDGNAPQRTIHVPTVPIPSHHRPETRQPPKTAPPATDQSFNTTMDSTASSDRRMMKRKVLRKIDGESHIFDESSVTESESDDIGGLQERLRQLPVRVHYDPPPRRPATAPEPRYNTYKKSAAETPAYRLSEDFEGPKALIKPMAKPPHEQNVRKTDRVARFQKYNQSWKSQKAPGEKAHKNLRWNVREQMLYHDEVVQKKQRELSVPNSYVVPTKKKKVPTATLR